MKKIKKLLDTHSWLVIPALFFATSLWFNFRLFWSQLIFDNSTTGRVWAEVRVFEWLTSKFYRIMISGKNPFGMANGMLYPFQIQVGLTDAGNGLFYPLFRSLFSSYQTFTLILALSQIIANVGMYLLLRKLNIGKAIAFIIALAFGYMTFLGPREGHMNYWVIYVFPWFYLSVLNLLSAKSLRGIVISASATAFFLVLSLWINFYYFIMILVSVGSFFGYFLLSQRKEFFISLTRNWRRLILTVVATLVILLPWLMGMYERLKFERLPIISGWGGAINYSADLFLFFIPGQYNHYIYTYFPQAYTALIKRYAPFADGAFENFVYPGVIILACYFLGIFFARRKSFAPTAKKILPYFAISLVFVILTLGPFLHVFGRWGLDIGEGIRLVIPLPYVLFHYVPLLDNIRVPGRLIVGFIFFAYIVSAYVLEYLFREQPPKNRMMLFSLLIVVFVLDHRYVDYVKPPTQEYPYKIFNEIKKDLSPVSVMEIPFVVRDGFTYFGDEDAVLSVIGESYHGKPVIGGYTGRIPDYVRAYYIRNPFFGYMGRHIDQNIQRNPIIAKDEMVEWQKLRVEASKDVIDFLDIKYIIVDSQKPYSATLSAQLNNLGFASKKKEGSFVLLSRTPEPREFLALDMVDPASVTYLGMGWHVLEDDFRWSKKKNSFMFKVLNPRDLQLKFIAGTFTDDIPGKIYVNKKKVGSLVFSKGKQEYSLPIQSTYFIKGINTIHVIFDSFMVPSEVVPGSEDLREISGRFWKIWLSEL